MTGASLLMTDKESIQDMETELTGRVKDLAVRGLHDVTLLQSLMQSLNDHISYLPGMVERQSLSKTCSDVIYYCNKMLQYALCLETITKIKTIQSNDQNGIQPSEKETGNG